MRAAVLFSGIGGWEIACEWNGVDVAWSAEWDDWKRARYLERWPHATLYRDVAEIDGRRAVAERVWRDVKGVRTDGEAATITGWGLRTLQRKFGSSGRPPGWPKKDRS